MDGKERSIYHDASKTNTTQTHNDDAVFRACFPQRYNCASACLDSAAQRGEERKLFLGVYHTFDVQYADVLNKSLAGEA